MQEGFSEYLSEAAAASDLRKDNMPFLGCALTAIYHVNVSMPRKMVLASAAWTSARCTGFKTLALD